MNYPPPLAPQCMCKAWRAEGLSNTCPFTKDTHRVAWQNYVQEVQLTELGALG